MAELTGQHYIDIIDEIFNYRSNYTGFAIKETAGTVRILARKFDLSCGDVVVVLNQMLYDSQLREMGTVGFDKTYAPIRE